MAEKIRKTNFPVSTLPKREWLPSMYTADEVYLTNYPRSHMDHLLLFEEWSRLGSWESTEMDLGNCALGGYWQELNHCAAS